jgi:hypothetical protein
MNREIWFDRWLWSYFPCHWKGLLVTVATPALALILVFTLRALLRVNHPEVADLSYFAMLPIILAGIVVCERHSRDR